MWMYKCTTAHVMETWAVKKSQNLHDWFKPTLGLKGDGK